VSPGVTLKLLLAVTEIPLPTFFEAKVPAWVRYAVVTGGLRGPPVREAAVDPL